MHGKDAQDLLHRLSTNDLRRIPPTGSVQTVMTNEKGRVIDWVQVRPGMNRLLLVCHSAAREKDLSWIDRFILSEDVEILPITDSPVITSIILPHPDSSAYVELDRVLIEQAADLEFGIWAHPIAPFAGKRLALSPGKVDGFNQRIAAFDPVILTSEEYTALRVLGGTPSVPQELNDMHNPLESNLRDDISFSKGCYIGQEVIARLDSYHKVQCELVVLRVDGPWDGEHPPNDILSNGEHAGMVTSIGGTLADGSLMVMGYVDRSILERQGGLSVGSGSVALPARVFTAGDHRNRPWEMPA